jgi:hypothetical protein
MNKNLVATAPGTSRWPDLIAGALVVLWGGLMGVALASDLSNLPSRDSAGSVVARCDRMAQIVSNRTSAGSRDARGPQRRRERESAFASCLEDPDGFERSRVIQG